MRIGSLFSGAGGLDMAVEAVFGAETVWHCEIETAASKVLSARWPGVPNLGDITEVNWSTVEPVDILCGGFPCQDISSAGKRVGMGVGTRSGLWSEFARAIDELRPPLVVIENVRNLLSVKANRPVESAENGVGDDGDEPVLRGLGAVLGDLADIGFDADWATVSAASIGAPHLRERVFVIAHPAGSSGTHEPYSSNAVRQPLGSLSGASDRDRERSTTPRVRQLVTTADELATVDLLPTPSAADGDGGLPNRSGARSNELLLPGIARAYCNDELLSTPQARDYKGVPADGFNTANLCRDIALLPTPTAVQGRNETSGRSNPDSQHHTGTTLNDVAFAGQWGKYELAIRRWELITRPTPAPTEPNTKGNPRLSARFSEWMMGWPVGWVTDVAGISRNDQLRCIGNGVVPHQAYAALQWLLQIAEVAA